MCNIQFTHQNEHRCKVSPKFFSLFSKFLSKFSVKSRLFISEIVKNCQHLKSGCTTKGFESLILYQVNFLCIQKRFLSVLHIVTTIYLYNCDYGSSYNFYNESVSIFSCTVYFTFKHEDIQIYMYFIIFMYVYLHIIDDTLYFCCYLNFALVCQKFVLVFQYARFTILKKQHLHMLLE